MHNRQKRHYKQTMQSSNAQCIIEFTNFVTILTQKEVKLTTNSNIHWKLIVRKRFRNMHTQFQQQLQLGWYRTCMMAENGTILTSFIHSCRQCIVPRKLIQILNIPHQGHSSEAHKKLHNHRGMYRFVQHSLPCYAKLKQSSII